MEYGKQECVDGCSSILLLRETLNYRARNGVMKLNLTFEPDAKLLVSHRTWYRVNLFQLVQEHFGLRIVFLQKLDYRLMLDDKEERYDSEQL